MDTGTGGTPLLSTQQLRLLRLVVTGRLSYREAARRLGIGPEEVARDLRNALLALRSRLAGLEVPPPI